MRIALVLAGVAVIGGGAFLLLRKKDTDPGVQPPQFRSGGQTDTSGGLFGSLLGGIGSIVSGIGSFFETEQDPRDAQGQTAADDFADFFNFNLGGADAADLFDFNPFSTSFE